MGKCQADEENNKRWDSTVGGKSDGKIKIKKEKPGGGFDGKHEKSTKDLTGTCLETTETDRSHKIRFTVPANDHLYLGVFISDTKIEGFRLKLSDLVNSDDPPLNGGEDWVAVKGT